MPSPRGWEIVVILALLLLLFGAKRLPDAARGLGRSLRIFKAETKGLRDDDKDARDADAMPAERAELDGPAVPQEPRAPRPAEHEARER